MCSLEDDLHGMNLSLHAATDFDGDEDDDKFDIVLGDIDFKGDDKLKDDGPLFGEEEKLSRRKEVSDIEAGRLMPLFRLCEVSIFCFLLSFETIPSSD